jgi:hypothetical protein
MPSLESAQSLAAVFGLDTAEILSAVGLAGELTRIMEVSVERDATEAELSKLPEDVRRLFMLFYRARNRAQVTLAELETATERWMACSDERLTSLRVQSGLLDQSILEPRNSQLQARLADVALRFQELTHRLETHSDALAAARAAAMQATRPYQEAAIQLSLVFARLSN